MIPLTADDTRLLRDLGLFIEPVEVYDTDGKLLGLFVPANLEQCKQLAAKLPPVDRAEIDRLQNSKEATHPSESVSEGLKLLEQEAARRKAAGEKPLTPDEAVTVMDRACQQSTRSASATETYVETERCPTR